MAYEVDNTGTNLLKAGLGGASGAATGFVAGATIGGAAGPIGAVIGGIVGLGGSFLQSHLEDSAMNEQFRAQEELDAKTMEAQKRADTFSDEMNEERMELNAKQTRFQQGNQEQELADTQEQVRQSSFDSFTGLNNTQDAAKGLSRKVQQLGLRG